MANPSPKARDVVTVVSSPISGFSAHVPSPLRVPGCRMSLPPSLVFPWLQNLRKRVKIAPGDGEQGDFFHLGKKSWGVRVCQPPSLDVPGSITGCARLHRWMCQAVPVPLRSLQQPVRSRVSPGHSECFQSPNAARAGPGGMRVLSIPGPSIPDQPPPHSASLR